MKSAPLSEAARELKSLTASFAKLRILYYASETPTPADTIAERLGRRGPANSSQILTNLLRRGLLRAKANPADSRPLYSLTPNGRRLLATAKKHLDDAQHRSTTPA